MGIRQLKKQFFIFIAIALPVCLAGCASTNIGQAETDQAFPTQSEEDIKATLAKENPEALQEYEAAKARDVAVESQNSQYDGTDRR